MAYNSNDFDATVEPMGQKYAQPDDLGRTLKLILTSSTFTHATQSLAETESEWQDGIDEENIFVLPYIYENEDMSVEAVMQEFAGGDSLKVSEGTYAEKCKLHISVADMIKLQSYKNKTWRMFIVDDRGNILGTTPDGAIFKGFELTTFDVDKMNLTAGDVKRMVPIYYKMRNITEWSENAAVIKPRKLSADDWDPRDLDGLTDVEITVVSAIATKVVVRATAYLKGVAIVGFTAVTDWILATGQTITGVTDNGDGTYDLAGTGLVTGTITLGEPEDLTLDGYKSIGTAVVTIAP